MKNRVTTLSVLVVFVFLASTRQVSGDLIHHSNLSVESNTMGEFDSNWLIENVIDGSGLAGYAVDSPHEMVHSGNTWFSANGATAGQLVFDLGTTNKIDSIYFWNESEGSGSSGQEIPAVILETSLLPSSGFAFTSLGGGLQNILTGGDFSQCDVTLPSSLEFDAIDARYVRLTILSGNGGNLVGLREIAFSAVPEPLTVPFVLAGSIVIGMFRRNKHKSN